MKKIVIFVTAIFISAFFVMDIAALETGSDKLSITGKEEVKLFAHKWKTDNDNKRNRIETKLSFDMGYDINDKISLKLSPEIYLDNDDLTQGIIDSAIEENELRYAGGVEEAYLLYSGEQYDFSIGKKIYTWGKADGYKPLDNINSYEFTDIPDFRKLGVVSAAFNYAWPETSINFVLVPLFTPSRLPQDNNRWSGEGDSLISGGQFNSNFTTAQLNSYLTSIGSSLSGDDLSSVEARQLPGKEVRNMQYGIRLNTTKKGWDFSLSWYDGFNNVAVMRKEVTATKIHFIPCFNKMREIGGAFSTTFDRLEVHGETAWHFTDGQADDDYLEYIYGISYSWDNSQIPWFENTRIFLEYAGQKVTNYKSNDDYLSYAGYSRPFKNDLHGRLMIKINEANQFDLSGVYSFNDADTFFQPKFAHKFNDNWKMLLGMDWFTGEKDDFFGKWDRNDRVFSAVSYSF